MELTIVNVYEEFDLRANGALSLSQHPSVDNLKPGECVVFINTPGDRARIVTSNRLVLSWWRDAEIEDRCSLPVLNAVINEGVGCQMRLKSRQKAANAAVAAMRKRQSPRLPKAA